MLTQAVHDGRETVALEWVFGPELLDHLLEHRVLGVHVHMRRDARALAVDEDHGDHFDLGYFSEGVGAGEGVAHQHSERVDVLPFFVHIARGFLAAGTAQCFWRDVARCRVCDGGNAG